MSSLPFLRLGNVAHVLGMGPSAATPMPIRRAAVRVVRINPFRFLPCSTSAVLEMHVFLAGLAPAMGDGGSVLMTLTVGKMGGGGGGRGGEGGRGGGGGGGSLKL
eukprot:6299462-Pyramimonas_sp.AAC.1